MKMMLLSLLLSVVLATLTTSTDAFRAHPPIIGVMAHPFTGHGEYIAASYVKWVESAGGRVVPIPYQASDEYLRTLVPQLNGILFPGGAAAVSPAAQTAYDIAIELNDKGIHYPIWGTCLGFEWLLQITSNDINSLNSGLESENVSLPLNFTDKANESRLFSRASDEIMEIFASEPVTMNNHGQGMTPERFESYSSLTSFYDVLSLNNDDTGLTFISTIEAKKYPFYAVQFHPEKNMFELGEFPDGVQYEDINHSEEAILVSQHLANFFLSEARKNELHFDDPRVEHKSLIYNYKTSTVADPVFVQVYFFKHDEHMSYWRME